MNKPLISVIVPVYNCSKYIKKNIDSILKQDYTNFELIVINDGSSDDSLNIINSFNDKRIMVFSKPNEGVSSTRNLGIDKSNGEYIFFVDGDDYLEKNILSTFVDIINKQNPDLIMCGYFSETINGFQDKIFYRDFYYSSLKRFKKDIVMLYDKHLLYNVWNKLFKRDLIIKNKIKFPEFCFGEDIIFCQEYIKFCHSIYNSSLCLYHYVRELEGSLTMIYKPDLYDIKANENKVLISFFDELGIKKNKYIPFISKRFIERTIGCLENVHRSNDFSFLDKLSQVDHIINNKETIKYLKYYKSKNIKIKIILVAYKLRSKYLGYLFGKLLFIFRSKFPCFFNKIKNKR